MRPADSCYDHRMKLLLAMTLVLAGCGGTTAKRESPLVNEGSDLPADCCCKSNPLSSEDGKPVYEPTNRMECSAKPGECVADIQCKKIQPPP